MKPQIHILKYGGIKKLDKPKLTGALGLSATVGLVVYEKDGKKKGMVIDPGMVVDFEIYKNKLPGFDLTLADVTHLLLTHIHQDHVQAMAKFSDGTQVEHYGSSSLLGSNEYGAKVYDNFIEVPEITFCLYDNAHTKKDTVYIIDSVNEGKVAFVGDLMFASFNTLDKNFQKNLDLGSSNSPEKRFEAIKDFYEKYPDVEDYYLGHENRKISREEVGEYLEEWNKP